jgi:hypothetical protein
MKVFTSVNAIRDWLDHYKIKNYKINKDLTVDVDCDVNLFRCNLLNIMVNFNKVNGNFYIQNNLLTNLRGCPKLVVGNFDCANNRLVSLVGCPIIVGGYFQMYNNHDIQDANDLKPGILIKNIKSRLIIYNIDTIDSYFEHWIDKEPKIFDVLKDKVSNHIKNKYKHLFQANNFDLL